MSMRQLGKIARDCASGMRYLASKHIVHGNLKLRNVLYWTKNNKKTRDDGTKEDEEKEKRRVGCEDQ